MTGIRTRTLAAVLAAMLVGIPSAVDAGTVAGTGGSTEITQLMNHVELIKNAVSTAETVRNTLQSALYLKQTLKQLDPSTISQMMGVPLEQVQAMAQIHDQLGGLINSEQDIASRIQDFSKYSQASNMSPAQYLKTISQLAQARGGMYKTYLDSNEQALKGTQQKILSIQQTAASAPAVASQVEGLSKLLVANTQVQAQLVGLDQNMREANNFAAMAAQDRNNAMATDANKAAAEQASFENLKNVHIELPDPSQFAPGS